MSKELRKALKELRSYLAIELAIATTLEGKGKRTDKFPIDEYTRAKLIAGDALKRLDIVEAELRLVLKSRRQK